MDVKALKNDHFRYVPPETTNKGRNTAAVEKTPATAKEANFEPLRFPPEKARNFIANSLAHTLNRRFPRLATSVPPVVTIPDTLDRIKAHAQAGGVSPGRWRDAVSSAFGSALQALRDISDLIGGEQGLEAIARGVAKDLGLEQDQDIQMALRGEHVEHSQSRNASIEVTTRDGDKITIQFSEQSSQSASRFSLVSGNGSATAVELSRQQHSRFSFSIEGELDEGERRAIDELLGKLDKVAGHFDSGNMKAAIEEAQNLDYDGSELAGFEMSLDAQRSSRAVAAYQQTQQAPVINSALGDAIAFMQELNERTREAANTAFADPREAVKEMLAGMIGYDAEEFDDGRQAIHELLDQMERQFVGLNQNGPDQPA